MPTTKCYYLSGPMSGLPQFNVPAFAAAASSLRARGFDVRVPHEITADMEGDYAWEDYVRRDLIVMVRECTDIVLLAGWQKSKGASLELHVARALKMPVHLYLNGALENITHV